VFVFVFGGSFGGVGVLFIGGGGSEEPHRYIQIIN
jgi:hypothetical protein